MSPMKFFPFLFLTAVFLTQMPLGVSHDKGTEEVIFMRELMASINPSLIIEDNQCAVRLPGAIYRKAQEHQLDWLRMFVLAWQESDFDCHAKNRRDKGGAYGPFQIRRLWEPVTGDPRRRYYDPDLAVERVASVLNYYRKTNRYEELVRRGFRHPLLCLYNTGEKQRVNMAYCRTVGKKMRFTQKAWMSFRSDSLVSVSDPGMDKTLID